MTRTADCFGDQKDVTLLHLRIGRERGVPPAEIRGVPDPGSLRRLLGSLKMDSMFIYARLQT